MTDPTPAPIADPVLDEDLAEDTTVEHDGETYTLSRSRTERGTRILFGKLYHYGRNSAGNLVLLAGPDPRTVDVDRLLGIEA